jgi:hypothetical protein
MKFVATKKGLTTNFFSPLFCFWIRDPEWVKIRIQDKHPGSATLYKCFLRAAPPLLVFLFNTKHQAMEDRKCLYDRPCCSLCHSIW